MAINVSVNDGFTTLSYITELIKVKKQTYIESMDRINSYTEKISSEGILVDHAGKR